MPITTSDQLVAGLNSAQTLSFHKDPVTSVTAGFIRSLWLETGRPNASTAAPANGRSCGQSLSLPFTNPTGSRLSYAGNLKFSADAPGTLMIYDRLADAAHTCGPLSPANQNLASAVVNRPANGAGELWLESVAANPQVVTGQAHLVYVNQAGVSIDTSSGAINQTVLVPAGLPARCMVPLRLPNNDLVRSLTSITPTVAYGGSGQTANLVILRPIATVEVSAANVGRTLDAFALGLPQIANDVCLGLAWQPIGTTTARIIGNLQIVQG
jgi:hypothetical protein